MNPDEKLLPLLFVSYCIVYTYPSPFDKVTALEPWRNNEATGIAIRPWQGCGVSRNNSTYNRVWNNCDKKENREGDQLLRIRKNLLLRSEDGCAPRVIRRIKRGCYVSYFVFSHFHMVRWYCSNIRSEYFNQYTINPKAQKNDDTVSIVWIYHCTCVVFSKIHKDTNSLILWKPNINPTFV